MSKSANAGELRTALKFVARIKKTNENGVPISDEKNIFGDGAVIWGKWVNAHGSDSYVAMQLQLREPATITCRYSPLINSKLLVYKDADETPYEIISIDDVENRHSWLEIKVQREVKAK